MSDVDTIAAHIREIGEKMVADYQPAPDVVLDKKQGIIPRCLIFEKEGRNPHGQGSVVVGVNPGKLEWKSNSFTAHAGARTKECWHGTLKILKIHTLEKGESITRTTDL